MSPPDIMLTFPFNSERMMSCCSTAFEISRDETSYTSKFSVKVKNDKGATCAVVSDKLYILEICGN